MDQSKAIRLAAVALAAALLRGQTAEPADALERARDQYLAANRRTSRQVCIETIDRSYFHRADPLGRLSCEQLHEDRKKPRFKLSLDATDRLRVRVALVGDREVYSWNAPGAFSANVEEILDTGSMGTGAFRTFLLDIFSNPAVRFRLLDEKATELNFGYRVPLEGSHYYARAGRDWRATSYDGSISIDPASADVRRLVAVTSELPPQSWMCEVSTVLEFEPQRGDGTPVPRTAKAHEVMGDGSERDRVTTFSGCGEAEIPQERAAGPPVFPPGFRVSLALRQPLDWQTGAAGDVISAEVMQPVMQPGSGEILLPRGAVVSGRILRLIHQMKSPAGFFVTIGFDTLESEGVRSRFYARALRGPHTGAVPDGDKPDISWPRGTFAFLSRKSAYVLPAGFASKWITVAR